MRLTVRFIGCLLLISCVPLRAQEMSSSAAEAELLRLETALNEGVMHHDRPALEQILAEEFGLSIYDRPAAPRAAWLSNVTRMSVSGYKITEPHVSVQHRIAVVQTHQHFDDWKTGDVQNQSDYNIIDLWAYRAGRWQLVRRLSQASPQP